MAGDLARFSLLFVERGRSARKPKQNLLFTFILGIFMIKTLSAVAVAALTMVGGAQAALINNVDLFTTAQTKLIDNTVGGVVSSEVGSLVDATILGGFRELHVDQKAGDGIAESFIQVAGGLLRFGNEPGAGSTGTVRWDGDTAPVTGGAIDAIGLRNGGAVGINLGNVFTDFFELDVISADGSYVFRIEAYTDANNWSSVTINANQHPNPIQTYIPLAAFLDCSNLFPVPGVTVTCAAGNQSVDFSNLGALQAVIDVNGTATDLDLRLNQVTVVPEPNAIALVGLALLGAGVASRRRKV